MKNFSNLLKYKTSIPTSTLMPDDPKSEQDLANDILDTIRIDLIETYLRKKKLENISKCQK